MIPALFTRISTVPKVCSMELSIWFVLSASVRSQERDKNGRSRLLASSSMGAAFSGGDSGESARDGGDDEAGLLDGCGEGDPQWSDLAGAA